MGLSDLGTLEDVQLFPNPADNEIQISFSSKTGNNELVFVLTDLTGKMIRSIPVNAQEGSNLVFIETADLSAGTYLIKLADSASGKTFKFVKK
ncbi:hypothetical protein D3C80_1245720 [compost metagenome]